MKRPLAPKRRRFVEEYLIDLNATQAAIRAGYSPKTARVQASDLLMNPDIQKAVAEGQKRLREKTGNLAERVLRELEIIAFSDLRNYLDIDQDTGAIRAKSFDEIPDDASRALEQIREDRMIREDAKGEDSIINSKVTFKLHSKIAALEALAKHLGLYEKDNSQRVPKEVRVIYDDQGAGQK